MAGGGLRMGQVIGESSRKVEVPAENPVGPQDVMATILHMYGLGHKLQFTSLKAGPPTWWSMVRRLRNSSNIKDQLHAKN